ncbi:MAG: hypothetical protein CVT90_02415 [Candidatus Altiarchaeales archaeon HGW-Altiarchaeales-3]|nr:MAG: hypothetical protein CVT90_02415 [Candidatus Altiarchaeales archaeon HGW-Altiarchaeales-3]
MLSHQLKIKITSKLTSRKFRLIIKRKNPETLMLESEDDWLNGKTSDFAQYLIDNKWKPVDVGYLNKRNPMDCYLLKITLINSNKIL